MRLPMLLVEVVYDVSNHKDNCLVLLMNCTMEDMQLERQSPMVDLSEQLLEDKYTPSLDSLSKDPL